MLLIYLPPVYLFCFIALSVRSINVCNLVFDITEFVFFLRTIPVFTELTVERTNVCITKFDNTVLARCLWMIVVFTQIQ